MDKSTKEVVSDELIIVNRSKTYRVSKKLICLSIPYFEKMFSSNLTESKENKVTLDLDEATFQSILSATIFNFYVLRFDNVLQMSETADYLMLDKFHDKFLNFFKEDFTTEHVPFILRSINEFSNLINLKMINAFIRVHFLKIINTSVLLDYPFEAMQHILNLNLHIDSERQVITAIEKWITKDLESRKVHILELLKSIRWCHLEREELGQIKESESIKDLADLETIVCSPGSCKSNCDKIRAKPKSLIALFKIDKSSIGLVILDETYSSLPCGNFKYDDSLSSSLITDEWMSDIIYDSGRKGIRVDWTQRKFRYLDMIGSDESYYGQLYRYIMRFKPNEGYKSLYLEDEVKQVSDSDTFPGKSALLEFEGRFYACGYTKEKKLFALSPVHHRSWYYGSFNEPSIHSCLSKNIVFVVTKEGDHRLCNLETLSSSKFELSHDQKFQYASLQLTSCDSNFYLFDKSSKKIYISNVETRRWDKLGQIESPYELITLTTTYLPDEPEKTSFNFV